MSAPPATVTAWQWPADVLDFAARSQVAGYLDPLLEATRRLFPTARDLRVMLEADPEIRDRPGATIRLTCSFPLTPPSP